MNHSKKTLLMNSSINFNHAKISNHLTAFITILILLFLPSQLYGQGDICTSATTLIPGTSCTYSTGDISGNTVQDLNNGTCTGNLNDDVYFQFTATESTMTVNVDGSGSFDAVLGVFGGSCAALIQEGPCIDNTEMEELRLKRFMV